MKVLVIVLVVMVLTGCGGAADAVDSMHSDNLTALQPKPIPAPASDDFAALLNEARNDLQVQITLNNGYKQSLKAAESRENQAIAEAATLRGQLVDYGYQLANARTYKAEAERSKALSENLTGELLKANAEIVALTGNLTALAANCTGLE